MVNRELRNRSDRADTPHIEGHTDRPPPIHRCGGDHLVMGRQTGDQAQFRHDKHINPPDAEFPFQQEIWARPILVYEG